MTFYTKVTADLWNTNKSLAGFGFPYSFKSILHCATLSKTVISLDVQDI